MSINSSRASLAGPEVLIDVTTWKVLSASRVAATCVSNAVLKTWGSVTSSDEMAEEDMMEKKNFLSQIQADSVPIKYGTYQVVEMLRSQDSC